MRLKITKYADPARFKIKARISFTLEKTASIDIDGLTDEQIKTKAITFFFSCLYGNVFSETHQMIKKQKHFNKLWEKLLEDFVDRVEEVEMSTHNK